MALVPAARWFWRDDGGPEKWNDYGPEQSAQLESFAAQGVPEVMIMNGKYRVNFPQRKQINTRTGFARDIRRSSLPPSSAPSPRCPTSNEHNRLLQ